MKHKHAELIKAWADGAEIEFWSTIDEKWYLADKPSWDENKKYRIKHIEKKPVVRWLWAYKVCNRWFHTADFLASKEEMERDYPHAEHKRLDWSRTEFEE